MLRVHKPWAHRAADSEHLDRHPFWGRLMKQSQKHLSWCPVESPQPVNNWRPMRPTIYVL